MGRRKKVISEEIITEESMEEDYDGFTEEETNYEDSFEHEKSQENSKEKQEEITTAAKEIKEDKIITSSYNDQKLSKEDKNQALELKNSLLSALSNEHITGKDNSTTIPTGIDLLDTILGGGIGMRFNMIVGPPGAGKTTLACKMISTSQKKFKGKFISVFIDSESAMTYKRLNELGVEDSTILHNENITVESIFRIIEGIVKYKKENPDIIDTPSIIVWDSIASTNTEASLAVDDLNKVMGLKPRLLSFLLSKYVDKLNKYNISLVAVNQLRKKIDLGLYKKPADLQFLKDHEVPGGQAVLFHSSHLLFVRHCGKLDTDNYAFNGTRLKIHAVKNKLFTPNIEIESVIDYREGYSNFWTNYEMLKEYKRINTGPFCSLISMPTKKFRQKQVEELYNTAPEFKEAFDKEVENTLKTEFIDSYTKPKE